MIQKSMTIVEYIIIFRDIRKQIIARYLKNVKLLDLGTNLYRVK